MISVTDRWGATALNEANHNGHRECAKSLRNAGSFLGKSKHLDAKRRQAMSNHHYEDNEEVFFAAAAGDLFELITCNARGLSLVCRDYDGRTPLHLAAANGHHDCVRYLLVQSQHALSNAEVFMFVEAEDCFGGTALDDARREGHQACVTELQKPEWNDELENSVTQAILTGHEGQHGAAGSGKKRSKPNSRKHTPLASPRHPTGNEQHRQTLGTNPLLGSILKKVLTTQREEREKLITAYEAQRKELDELKRENARL
jgi:hypothetical protein